jgi:ribosomal protein S18 acetylase RimI-like enzyme
MHRGYISSEKLIWKNGMDIRLSKRGKDHEEFVLALFASHKLLELGAQNWPKAMQKQISEMQFNAFEVSIKKEYPGAHDSLISVDSELAGRIIVNETEDNIRIINLSLLPAFRNKGIGTKLIKDVISEASIKKKPVYFDVDKHNPAISLYIRLGFNVVKDNEVSYTMAYKAENH